MNILVEEEIPRAYNSLSREFDVIPETPPEDGEFDVIPETPPEEQPQNLSSPSSEPLEIPAAKSSNNSHDLPLKPLPPTLSDPGPVTPAAQPREVVKEVSLDSPSSI